MKKKYSKTAAILIVSAFAVSVSPAADLVRWDFAGSFTTRWGLACTQPGAHVGASITGSMIIPNSDNITAYVGTSPSPNETSTVFGISGPTDLSMNLSYDGNSYDYTGSFYFVMYNGLPGAALDEFWFSGSCSNNLLFQIHLFKFRTGVTPTPPTLSSFLDGTGSLPPPGGSATVTLGDRSLLNTVSGSLTLLSETITPVPEPSTIGLCGIAALACLFRRLRRTKP